MRNYETKVYDYIDKKTGQHIVKAITMYAGKPVSAIARCDLQDIFDFEFGKKLALTRLDLKIAEKRAASMKASSKFCRMNLEFVEQEKRRLKKALTRAEVSYSDRMVEVQQFKDEINTMLAGI